MTTINTCGFFTPVSFQSPLTRSWREFALEAADDYFYLSGKKAIVVPNCRQDNKEGILLNQYSNPLLLTILKVISYCTIILPLIMLTTKIILRSTYKFYVIPPRKLFKNMTSEDLTDLETKFRERFPKDK